MNMHRIIPALALAAAFLAPTPAGVAFADQITVEGKTYRDVLIDKSRSYYYVRLPKEGRIINVPVSEVDESAVTIDDDPFYRDELKDLFKETLERVKAGERIEASNLADASAFRVLPQQQGGGGFAFGGTRGSGLGVPRALMVQGAKALGITFQPLQGNVLNGKSPDGSQTIKLTGPPEGLTEIIVKVSGNGQQIMESMQSIMVVAAMIAPWSTQWLAQNLSTLVSGGIIQKTQDGVFVKMESVPNTSAIITIRSV